ncbi:MAG: 4Fe-4S dicluster domain-containing protein [Bacillota bacterium]
MSRITIREEGCKGCSYCVLACKRKLIRIDQDRINNLGYNPAVFSDNNEEPCTGCALCAEICPEVLIEVYRQQGRVGA